MSTPSPKMDAETLRQIVACCKAMDDKKAENIRVLYLGEDDSLTTYFVLVTGNSQPHLRALRISLEKALDECGLTEVRSERDTLGGWIVVDAGDFMVHVFTEAMRSTYKIELLKRDSKDITDLVMAQVLEPPPPPPPAPAKAPPATAKKPKAPATKKKTADTAAKPRATAKKPKAATDAEKPKRAPRKKKTEAPE